MGRGKQSESFTLEEVARYGIDDFSDQEIADLRARDRQLLGYREKLSEGGISNDALAEIQSSLAFTSALADGGSSETIEELLELLATAHVLNFAGVAGDSLSFDRLARPRMTLFGLIEPETSLICHEQKFSTEILHLRSSPMEDSALCGYELSVAQQRRWPRGVFQANRPTCAECFHLATIGAVDSALYERATESEDYVALDLTESEEIDAALAATCADSCSMTRQPTPHGSLNRQSKQSVKSPPPDSTCCPRQSVCVSFTPVSQGQRQCRSKRHSHSLPARSATATAAATRCPGLRRKSWPKLLPWST